MNEQTPTIFGQKQSGGGMMDVAMTRVAQEVQAAMVIAKKFPRNEEASIERIRKSCQRKTLAEVAAYAYPKGGTTVTGPSIRLAECIAQNWGNMESGVIELERKNGASTAMAYAWDLETNTRDVKIFDVPHVRDTKKGSYAIEDNREIYELVANVGARRKRACILAVIPGDVVDIAQDECDKTLMAGAKEPLIDRVRKMAAAFSEFGVTVPMLELRLQHNLSATIEQELVTLRKIYTSIKDGHGKREDYFEVSVESPKFKSDEKSEAAAGMAPSAPVSAPPAPAIVGGSPANPTPAAENPRDVFRRKLVEHGIAAPGFIAYALAKELIRTPPPENEPDPLGITLAAIHGKTVNRLITEIETIAKWVAETKQPDHAPTVTVSGPGELTQPQKDLVTRIQEAGITVGQFLTWANDTGQTDEATDIREVPENRCLAILKAWEKIEGQIKLIPA